MDLNEGRQKFLQAWGTIGTNWGISRTMAQVHALLLVSDVALTTENIMDELNISRGNANQNIRALMDWGLITKEIKSGDRKEYFNAEKDIWKVSRMIARERRKRELEPALKILEELQTIKENNQPAKNFKKVITEIHDYTGMVNSLLEKYIHSNNNWLIRLFSHMMK